jgi:hypothetical protein
LETYQLATLIIINAETVQRKSAWVYLAQLVLIKKESAFLPVDHYG